MYILNKHIRWREEAHEILICDCKRLIDLKINKKFKCTLEKFEGGFEEINLSQEEKLLFLDFKKLKLLSNLKIRQIKEAEFPDAMKILEGELKDRTRSNKFLFEKFKQFSEFFMGIFIDKSIIGVICGFPRDYYLLISELAVDSKFQGRGFGKKLIETFEKTANGKYDKINVGAEDNAVPFYRSLGYTPFLLIQYKKGDYTLEDFNKFKIIRKTEDKKYERLEVEAKIDTNLLNKFRKKFPFACFQYIFTKTLL